MVTIVVDFNGRVKKSFLKINYKAKIVAETTLQFQVTFYTTVSPENSL
jgi:hypothetical protein